MLPGDKTATKLYTAPMLIDYHCHTTASDGALTPPELLALARERGVTSLAITDHDTLDAYRLVDSDSSGPELIAGIELSTHWRGTGVHIVGLHVAPDSDAMVEAVHEQGRARALRAETIAEKLEHYGLVDALSGARQYAGGDSLGRPHFARHMVASGFVNNEREAYKRFLGSGKPCDIKHTWASPQQVVAWIREAGGVAVLAHPGKYKMTRTRLQALVDDFIAWGGEAIEVVSGLQVPAQTRDLAALCRARKLMASWGSDFHQPGQPWAELGRYSTPPADVRPVWHHWQ